MAKKIFDYELVTYKPTNFQIVPSTVNVTVGCDQLDSNHLERFLMDGGLQGGCNFIGTNPMRMSSRGTMPWARWTSRTRSISSRPVREDVERQGGGREKQVNGLLDAAWEKEKKQNTACLKYKLTTAVTVSAAVLSLAKSIAALVASAGTADSRLHQRGEGCQDPGDGGEEGIEERGVRPWKTFRPRSKNWRKTRRKAKSTVSAAESALKDYDPKTYQRAQERR